MNNSKQWRMKSAAVHRRSYQCNTTLSISVRSWCVCCCISVLWEETPLPSLAPPFSILLVMHLQKLIVNQIWHAFNDVPIPCIRYRCLTSSCVWLAHKSTPSIFFMKQIVASCHMCVCFTFLQSVSMCWLTLWTRAKFSSLEKETWLFFWLSKNDFCFSSVEYAYIFLCLIFECTLIFQNQRFSVSLFFLQLFWLYVFFHCIRIRICKHFM